MNDEQYDLLYILNRFVNDFDDTVDSVLAKYFLNHYFQAETFNIYKIAAECNVSRSSIRRFATKMGYKNFHYLKRKMVKLNDHPNCLNDKNYRRFLTENIIHMTTELDQRMDTDQIEVICDHIRNSNHFFVLCSGQSISAIKDFQVKLAAKGRIFKMISGPEKIQELEEKITPNDCVLVISISGTIAKNIGPIMKRMDSTKILITANRIDSFDDQYTSEYYMSHLDHSRTPELYRKYGLNYFLDIISNHY